MRRGYIQLQHRAVINSDYNYPKGLLREGTVASLVLSLGSLKVALHLSQNKRQHMGMKMRRPWTKGWGQLREHEGAEKKGSQR